MKLLAREIACIIELITFIFNFIFSHTYPHQPGLHIFILRMAISYKIKSTNLSFPFEYKKEGFIFFADYYGGLSERHLHSLHVSFISAAKSY